MNSKEILITGTDGFIGNSFKSHLISEGFNVFGTTYFKEPENREISLDIRNPEEFSKLPDENFDIVIHTAGIIDQSEKARKILEVNAQGTKHILNWAYEHRCNHFIHISSTTVYGLRVLGEFRSEETTKRYNGIFALPYMRSKAKAEKYVQESGLAYTILRLPAVLGANDSYITNTIMDRLMNESYFTCGNKDRMYSTCYIKNLNLIISKLIETGPLNDCFNCCDEHISWREFVKEYGKHLNIDIREKKKSLLSVLWHFRNKPYLLILTFSRFGAHYPNDLLLGTLGIKPKYSWQEGIEEAIHAYLSY